MSANSNESLSFSATYLAAKFAVDEMINRATRAHLSKKKQFEKLETLGINTLYSNQKFKNPSETLSQTSFFKASQRESLTLEAIEELLQILINLKEQVFIKVSSPLVQNVFSEVSRSTSSLN